MALVIPPDNYQCLIPFRHDRVTRPAAITFGVRVEPGVENPEAVADDVLLALSTSFRTTIDSEVVVGPVIVTFDQGADGRGSISGSSSFVGGSGGGTAIPSNSALLIRKNTGRVGRPGRGRMFIPWCLQPAQVDEVGTIADATRIAQQARADALITALQGDDMEMVILHQDDVPGTTVPSLVTSLTIDTRIGTQRRRLRF